MFEPTEAELAAAIAAGIDPAGKGAVELRRLTHQARLRQIDHTARLRGHGVLAGICNDIGVVVPQHATSQQLVALFRERLPEFLAERGLVAGARIFVDNGLSPQYSGAATLGKLRMAGRGTNATLPVAFDGAPQTYAYSAVAVAQHARPL